MTTNTMKCTAPGCAKDLRVEEAWLPEMAAMVRASGGTAVSSADFAKFCLCGKHGHLLRQEGVRVYRFQQTVDFAKNREERAKADELSWKPFAERFKTNRPAEKAKPRQPRRPQNPGVGGGLNRLSKMDAEKRRIKEQDAKSADPTPAEEASKA